MVMATAMTIKINGYGNGYGNSVKTGYIVGSETSSETGCGVVANEV